MTGLINEKLQTGFQSITTIITSYYYKRRKNRRHEEWKETQSGIFFSLKVHCASEGFCVGNEGLKEGGGLGVLGGEGTASLVRWHC